MTQNKSGLVRYFAGIVIILLATGFMRDFIFKSINALLKARDYSISYEMPGGLSFMETWDSSSLISMKWMLTILFSILYLAITLHVVRTLFKRNIFLRITLIAYFLLFVISGIIMGFGYLLPDFAGSAYTGARYLMGIAQSPVVLMVLIPAFKLYPEDGFKSQTKS